MKLPAPSTVHPPPSKARAAHEKGNTVVDAEDSSGQVATGSVSERRIVPAKWRRGIARKIAGLCWVVTFVALGAFAIIVISEQKEGFRNSLHSKGRGVAVALRNQAAGAIVNEDFGEVVDQGMRLLNEDPELIYLVVVPNTGSVLIIERSSWRMEEKRAARWLPSGRTETGGIYEDVLTGLRSFRSSVPLDYSGADLGWVHVGLSLSAYDLSVARVYQRTAGLAALCFVLSGLAAVAYAGRLVRPLHSLQDLVRQVARGKLSARTEIKTGDEIEGLARSFNTMTDALQSRDGILECVRFAAQEFLRTDDWQLVTADVLSKFGQAAKASRAFLLDHERSPNGAIMSRERYAWSDSSVANRAVDGAVVERHWQCYGLVEWVQLLEQGGATAAHFQALRDRERAMIDPQARSALAMPIMVQGEWWGLLGLSEAREVRAWSEAERDSLKAMADMLGAAIERQRTRDALVEAKQHLEHRVVERTRQLVTQVTAKEAAHAELAKAQRRLMDASRQAGMAEVATGVLHNVGNALNSVNVSANLVGQRLRNSRLGNLGRLADLVKAHSADLAGFLTSDPKGRAVPSYLVDVANHLQQEHALVLAELQALVDSVEHAKGIVAVQQSYAKVGGMVEMLPLETVVEDALRVTEKGLNRHDIKVVRDFHDLPAMAIDRHTVLQILQNLLRNAKDAIKQARRNGQAAGLVTIRGHCRGNDRVALQIQDDGVGISPETINQLFSYGFTTKSDGHGFGLHQGALAAKEMKGTLSVASDGLGRGAIFTLELPLGPKGHESISS